MCIQRMMLVTMHVDRGVEWHPCKADSLERLMYCDAGMDTFQGMLSTVK